MNRNLSEHIQYFQMHFLKDQNTLQDLKPQDEAVVLGNFCESVITESKSDREKQHQINVQHLNLDPSIVNQSTYPKKRQLKSAYKFNFKWYLLECLIAYTIFIVLMYLSKVADFPFFQVLLIFIIAFSLKPLSFINIFIILTVPMAIANYNLGVWVLTYPQIIICYFSTYIFARKTWKNLIWIINTVIYAIFGFIVIVQIGLALKQYDTAYVAFYYLYPPFLVLIKTGASLLNSYNIQSNLFVFQLPFFLNGLSYGIVLTLNTNSVEFWYLIVMLTLEIVNTNYQFLLRILIKLINFKQASKVQAKCIGYSTVHSFHVVILIYLIAKLTLNSVRFSYDLSAYIQEWQNPLVIWIFFQIYMVISIIKLRKREKFMIIGFRKDNWKKTLLRGVGLSCGLWFFYLGLCIPYSIFYS